MLHVRICAGGRPQGRSLPRPPTQLALVDVTSAPNITLQIRFGVSDRRALGTARAAGSWTTGIRPVPLAAAADGPNRWSTFACAPGGQGGPHPVRAWAAALARRLPTRCR